MLSNVAVLWLCLIGIVVAIICHVKLKVNMGLVAMAFAFAIGCLGQGLKAATVFEYWPDNIAFFLMAASLFYGFARENGTLEVFGNKILYQFRNHHILIPAVVFGISFVLGLLGTGSATIFFVAPIAYTIGLGAGSDPLFIAYAVNTGYAAGTMNPWTGSGVIPYGIVESTEGAAERAFSIYIRSYGTLVLKQFAFLAILYVFFYIIRKHKVNKDSAAELAKMEKPADFTSLQKKTFALIIASFIILVLPNVINAWVKIQNPFFKNLIALCKPQAICIIFAVIANFMRLGDMKKVIAKLPMNTVLLIAGVSFLMEIAKGADLINIMVGLFGENMPALLVAPLLALLGGFLSLFSSATGVVMPLLFPMVPALVAATGLNPIALYAAILIGSDATSLSPVSTAGSQLLALAPTDEIRESLFGRQAALTVVVMMLTVVFALVGLFGIFTL